MIPARRLGAALDALPSPSFDPESRRVTSKARTSPTNYVTELYEYSGNRLVLVRGRYRLTVRELVDGQVRVTDERLGDES